MRNPVLALAGLLAGLLALAVPGSTTLAQSQIAPVAVAVVGDPTVNPQTQVATVALDGSGSFDPDPGGAIASYKWTVVTEDYLWLGITGADSASASFTVPSRKLADEYGQSIEFKLTVTDSGTPAASASTTVVYNIDPGPTVDISVSAKLLNPDDLSGYDDDQNGVVDDNDERYTLEGMIDAPGQNGNADNEWHIRDGSLLTIDGSGSSSAGGPLPASSFSWTRLYASSVPAVTASLPDHSGAKRTLSTDEDPTTVGAGETLALLPYTSGDEADPYFLYYTLTVTDRHGRSASSVVKIVIRDQPADPKVEIGHPESDPSATAVAAKREGVLAAGKNRYVVLFDEAEDGVTLVATATADGRGRSSQLTHTWSGTGVAPSSANQPGDTSRAVFTAPAGTEQGTAFTIKVVVVDPAGRSGEREVEVVVADNRAPSADVLVPDGGIDTPDGPNGGWPEADPPTGEVVLRGVGFDPDGDPLTFQWRQVRDMAGKELDASFQGPRLTLSGSATPTASFDLPEVTMGTRYQVYLEFEVADRWGVPATEVVQVVIHDGDDDLKSVPGSPQKVPTGSFVRLLGGIRSGLVSADAISRIAYSWEYKGIETFPRTEARIAITPAEEEQGFVAGEWFPNSDGAYNPTAGGRLKGADGRYPYFDAPELGGFDSIKLTFELTVELGVAADSDYEKDTATVTVTVVNGFFSGVVTGPGFCLAQSLGGPATYAFDSDLDGVADVCSLSTTRRATVARQNALETLAALNSEAFKDHLHGKAEVEADATADPPVTAVAAIASQCAAAPRNLGDSAAALAADSCGPVAAAARAVSAPPKPVDPTTAGVFFSGVVDGPHFCANLSLGGPTTYAFDSDGDGVADVCSLPYTRREAIARQKALEMAFSAHAQYGEALKAACAALGTTAFQGDTATALARDECSRPPTTAPSGKPLPTPDT